MNAQRDNAISPATTLALAVAESRPDSTYGAVPLGEQRAALEAYLAYDEGVFEEAPLALDAYLAHQLDIV